MCERCHRNSHALLQNVTQKSILIVLLILSDVRDDTTVFCSFSVPILYV